MSILEYANDVSKEVLEIKKLCDKLGVNYKDENSSLSDEDITLLDNEIANNKDLEPSEDYEFDEELEDKAEELAKSTRFDLDDVQNLEKVKPKAVLKDNKNKKDFIKAKKELYKHREKLQSNELPEDNDVILFKEGMTVGDLARDLHIAATELIKKLIGLKVMATINHVINFDLAEILVMEYGKQLKKEETQDISNFENYEIIDKEESLQDRPPVVT
ncbi:MAG: translation initiation factor IF-2 N-terminal domain-containing protein, partial [Bacilli bacterium]